ncbi:LINE-1 retrotransposable element ORF2 protein [Eumeta japonica]|uniref:LINE-1 retrotransposable element ORF2 protein n=1 Tax=Eumeta variegata TaxID=151549 RepID=A0A4C1WAK4_EUMVA|nr:LINE-1 retrotransposable element ORF2 protein [Eumeta japonica]
MKDERGKMSYDRTDILETATSYYKKLYGSNNTQDRTKLLETSSISEILHIEVEKAIDSQKNDKAPGPDDISNEILRHSKETLTPILTEIFNNNLNTEIIPQQWTESNIILLYKKEDKYDIANYRPISLMSNVYKIFAKIILKRIEKTLDEHQPIEQAGFRKDYSIDHIHVVRQILEKYNEYQLTYYIEFIDYSKAFDSLRYGKIWEALLQQGIEQKYIRLIKNIYSCSTARIQLEKKSAPIRIERGVRQRDPLSPKLFSAVLESIFRRLNWEYLGLNVDGVLLSHLRFADDIVLLGKTSEDLNKMIKELATECEKVGLTLNPEKTRTMTNGIKFTIKLKNTIIDYTDEYIYLGQIITQKEPMRKEIQGRITNDWKRYWSLREVMKDKTLHINIKSKLFNTCVLPILTYGCQTWALNQETLNKLATCQYAMERSMLNVKKSDRLKNKIIRNKINTVDVTTKVKKLKWRWVCHVIRGHDKCSKRVTRWYPGEGKRKKGRPQKRWDDDIRQVAGVMWNRVAQDRNEWKRLEEAFADWQTDLGKIAKEQILDEIKM